MNRAETTTLGISLHALSAFPFVEAGNDLAGFIIDGLVESGIGLVDRDVVVVAQKVVSKAEGRIVDLATVTPSARAVGMAAELGKDPRLVEVILSETKTVLRARPNLIVVEHRAGYVMANAGVDQSNVAADNRELALLLPEDSDRSAALLRERLEGHFGCRVGVIVNDSFGRPWRKGTVGVALGVAGLPSVVDLRGEPDLFGRTLKVSEVGFADEIAAAASLLMGQAAEGRPVVLVRGLAWTARDLPGQAICREPEKDMFR